MLRTASQSGYDVAFEVPLGAELVLQQEFIGTGRLAVDAVVGAHDRRRFSLNHRGAKGRQVGIDFVVFADIDVGDMTRGFRPAVHGEVFRS